jgi:hypothetical protein
MRESYNNSIPLAIADTATEFRYPPGSGPTDPPQPIQGIVVHHTGTVFWDRGLEGDRLAELRQISRETPHLFTRAMEAEQIRLIEAKMARKPAWG